MHMVIYNRGNLRRLNCEAAQVICMTWKTAPLLIYRRFSLCKLFFKKKSLAKETRMKKKTGTCPDFLF